MIFDFGNFLIRAGFAGLGVALAAAPLGCFIVWRRMAYFGDAVAHAAILGVALALAFSISIFIGTIFAALAMALAVSGLSGRVYAADTMLGVLSHAALAISLVAVSLLHDVRLDLSSYLFGDILAVGRDDLAVIWGGVTCVLGLMWLRWQALLITTLNPDLATSAGIKPRFENTIFTLALAIVVAVAIKVVGALLIAAFLIIPASAARAIAKTPEAMVFVAASIGAVSAMGGLALAYYFDTPAGPSMVCMAFACFALTNLARMMRL
jgi:zinc transport system permease protein